MFERLATKIATGGYRFVRVQCSKTGRRFSGYVHRLVLEAFVGPPPFKGAIGRHLNDKPTDNRIANLRWGTGRDNLRDAARNGHGSMKLNERVVAYIKAQYLLGCSRDYLAATFDITPGHVYSIGVGTTWSDVPPTPGLTLDAPLDHRVPRTHSVPRVTVMPRTLIRPRRA